MTWGVLVAWLTSVAFGVVSAIIPVVNAEVYVDDAKQEQPMAALGVNDRLGFAVWTRDDVYDCIPLDIGPDTFRTFQFLASVARRVDGDRRLVGTPIIPKETTR